MSTQKNEATVSEPPLVDLPLAVVTVGPDLHRCGGFWSVVSVLVLVGVRLGFGLGH